MLRQRHISVFVFMETFRRCDGARYHVENKWSHIARSGNRAGRRIFTELMRMFGYMEVAVYDTVFAYVYELHG